MGKRSTASRTGTRSKSRGRKRRKSFWRRYGTRILLAVGLVVAMRTFVVQGCRVPSHSMEDTLLAGEYVLVDKLSYGARVPFTTWRMPGWREPRAGDIVVFRGPHSPGDRLYVKRCVAVAGQVVEGRRKVIYVDGERIVDPPRSKYMDARVFPRSAGPRDNFGPVKVPLGSLFVVGNNRDRSRDSRHWGPLALEAVVGRATVVCWSREPPAAPGHARSSRRRDGGLLRRLWDGATRVRWSRIGRPLH